ncbi:MAG: phage shock protein operon transcriptional activator [Deltaproteobacteria bacterium]|jgi:psp operon transcriptional activator|nr:phage shock protein operon transcriptional activator [Deltaproteobacteria bacterium]MBT4526650.1 phage shock protein operon transcriptional activator [Deltaproteobacteria bacterium]
MKTHHQIRRKEAIGQSEKFLAFQEQLSKVAPIDRPVLILGERGTGKELAVTRLHYLSKRWEGNLVALNCAALPATLIEAELFGHEKGAFTGAGGNRIGRFEQAHNGTFFLDEIGNIPMEVQEKILRVVEYGIFERVGSSESIEVDARLIAATNADLPAMVANNQFKDDLLDRLSFEVIYLPPLRERKEDILLLANHFARRMASELNLEEMPKFSDGAVAELTDYLWPGNIRELKNVVERAVYKADTYNINTVVFNPFFAVLGNEITKVPIKENKISQNEDDFKDQSIVSMGNLLQMDYKSATWELQKILIRQALKQSHYNQKKSAQILGLSYDQFRGVYKKMSLSGAIKPGAELFFE